MPFRLVIGSQSIVIGRLTGTIVEQGLDEGACVIDVPGVGYEVLVPLARWAGFRKRPSA